MDPVMMLRKYPPMPHGISRCSAEIGIRLAMPNRRMSNIPTVPISRESPMKCSDSQIGQPHLEVMMGFTISTLPSVVRSQCWISYTVIVLLLLGEPRISVGKQAARKNRPSPAEQGCTRQPFPARRDLTEIQI